MRRVLLGVVTIIGCAHDPDTTRAARNLIASSGNVASIRSLLRAPLGYGGIYFPDPTCRQRFPDMGIVTDDEGLDALAKCIAQLPLTLGTRNITDGLVVTYPPGFELEVRTFTTQNATWIRWIGFVSRRDFKDALPTIEPETLESLRTAGDREPAIDPDTAAKVDLALEGTKLVAYAWFKVCIDEAGAISNAYPRQTTSPLLEKSFAAAIATWRFRPFVVGDKPLAVCSVLDFVHAPNGQTISHGDIPMGLPITGDGLSTLLSSVLGPLVAGNKMIVPPDTEKTALHKLGVERVTAAFRYCIDEGGAVTSVSPVEPSGLARYDRELQREMMKWRHKPYLVDNVPTPVCATAFFIYQQH
jgi:hypothetical protein